MDVEPIGEVKNKSTEKLSPLDIPRRIENISKSIFETLVEIYGQETDEIIDVEAIVQRLTKEASNLNNDNPEEINPSIIDRYSEFLVRVLDPESPLYAGELKAQINSTRARTTASNPDFHLLGPKTNPKIKSLEKISTELDFLFGDQDPLANYRIEPTSEVEPQQDEEPHPRIREDDLQEQNVFFLAENPIPKSMDHKSERPNKLDSEYKQYLENIRTLINNRFVYVTELGCLIHIDNLELQTLEDEDGQKVEPIHAVEAEFARTHPIDLDEYLEEHEGDTPPLRKFQRDTINLLDSISENLATEYRVA
jgi:hypothetical protein